MILIAIKLRWALNHPSCPIEKGKRACYSVILPLPDAGSQCYPLVPSWSITSGTAEILVISTRAAIIVLRGLCGPQIFVSPLPRQPSRRILLLNNHIYPSYFININRQGSRECPIKVDCVKPSRNLNLDFAHHMYHTQTITLWQSLSLKSISINNTYHV